MSLRKALFGLCTVLATLQVQAETHEIQNIREILEYVDTDTLVFLDLDNTVLEAAQSLGTDQWFDHYLSQLTADGRSFDDAMDEAVKVYKQVHDMTAVKPCEPSTPRLISCLQRQGITVLGLTSRNPILTECTDRQLQSIAVQFSQNVEQEFSEEFREKFIGHFEKGVIFVGFSGTKGEVIESFFAHSGLHPKKVLFVDDKSHHVESVNKHLEGSELNFVGLRYGGTDHKRDDFDPQIANIQMQHLQKILSDEDAQRLMQVRG